MNDEWIQGSEPVADRLNVRRELGIVRHDPLSALLKAIDRPDHSAVLVDEVARWELAWSYYSLSFRRLIPAIAVTLRWMNGPQWTLKAGRRFSEREKPLVRRYRELRPYLDLDFANFLMHARVLCDRAAGLARYFVRGHPLPSFTSFTEHRAFFAKGRSGGDESARYGADLLTLTTWFEMPLKHVRDKFMVHTGPRHMPFFGQGEGQDLELVLIVPDGDNRTRPLERVRIVQVSARRLVREIDAFLRWFADYGTAVLRSAEPRANSTPDCVKTPADKAHRSTSPRCSSLCDSLHSTSLTLGTHFRHQRSTGSTAKRVLTQSDAAADANPRHVSRSLLLCRVRVGAAERQAVSRRNTMPIQYVFRKPRFPVIVTAGDRVFAAPSPARLGKLLARESPADADIRLLDSTWEWFEFVPDVSAIAPSFVDRSPPTKAEVISLVNDRANRADDAPQYLLRSLSSRSREDIFAELLALLPAG
jgi:hypothetical protein